MIENRESDERVCCVLSLSLFLSLYYEDTFVFLCFSSRSYEKKKTREVTNRRQISPLTSFFFCNSPQKFHRAHTTRIINTQKHTHIHKRVWFRKEEGE